MDFRKAEITKAGQPLELSAREFQLLRYFVEHRGATLSREELLNEVWGYNSMPSTRTVDVHVAWLRQKIEPNSAPSRSYILTVHGLGYKFAGLTAFHLQSAAPFMPTVADAHCHFFSAGFLEILTKDRADFPARRPGRRRRGAPRLGSRPATRRSSRIAGPRSSIGTRVQRAR